MSSPATVQAHAPMDASSKPTSRVCFLYIAQPHHLWHSLSAAVELARRRPDIEVEIAAANDDLISYARLIVGQLGGAPLHWRRLGPGWLRGLAGKDHTPPKIPMLVANAATLGGYDAIVAPERTTAALKLLGVRKPKLIYTQHGAGDRGGVFEPRLSKFDLVFAAGAKFRDRMVDSGLVAADRCAVVGYPKFDMVDRIDPPRPRLFRNDRPIVLYNPHFHRRLSSWPKWGTEVLWAFANQSDYNLIFAPHLRLFQGRAAEDIEALTPFLRHPGIHIDLGDSSAAVDMSYTRMADIYLGDVSSQVYEFIRRPRPCLFLNPHGVDWQDDESYRHWRFGPVLDDVGGLMADIAEARRPETLFQRAQAEAFRYTFDDSGEPASVRAAQAIANVVDGGAP